MKSYLLPMILLAGCVSAPEPEPAPTQSALYDGFVGQRFAWDHVSGVSGETMHYADGTMVYDSNGRERSAPWTLSVDDRYCMNAGEYEQVCFTLVPTPTGYASQDGTFRYERLPDPIGTTPYGAGFDAPAYGAPAEPFDATRPPPGTDAAPAYDAPGYNDAMGYDASIYDTPADGAPLDATGFSTASELPIVTSPID